MTKGTTRRLTGLLATLGVLAATANAAPALADSAGHDQFGQAGTGDAVFVQTDGLAGNQIVAYHRRDDGTLTQTGVYATGGNGGQLTGSVVDHTASQGALTYDAADNVLLAVNAGSNTISVFSVFGDHLLLRQVIGTNGTFPVSVTARRGEAFVLNAENGGSLQGYAVVGGHLLPVPWLHRSLGLATGKPGEPEQFTHTPGQVAFTPDGSKLVLTTKAAGQSVEVFKLFFGGIAQAPTVTADPTVPFAVSFDPQGHLLLAEAAGALASFQINNDGSLTQLASVATEQAATCWVTPAAGYYYTSNAGSSTLSGFRDTLNGQLALLGNTPTHAGTVDGASAGDNLYVQGGKEGTVDEFTVSPSGALTPIGSLVVPGAAGGEGIATT